MAHADRRSVPDAVGRALPLLSLSASALAVAVHGSSLPPRLLPPWTIGFGRVDSFVEALMTVGFARAATPLFFCISGYLLAAGAGPFLPRWRHRLATMIAFATCLALACISYARWPGWYAFATGGRGPRFASRPGAPLTAPAVAAP